MRARSLASLTNKKYRNSTDAVAAIPENFESDREREAERTILTTTTNFRCGKSESNTVDFLIQHKFYSTALSFATRLSYRICKMKQWRATNMCVGAFTIYDTLKCANFNTKRSTMSKMREAVSSMIFFFILPSLSLSFRVSFRLVWVSIDVVCCVCMLWIYSFCSAFSFI